MIDPKLIERLWEKCPELRPEGMSIHGGVLHAWSMCRCDFDPPMSDAYAHALIRDRIVWWLAEKGLYLHPVTRGGDEWFFQLMANDTRLEHLMCESGHDLGADPTLACILAAERVLGLPEWADH